MPIEKTMPIEKIMPGEMTLKERYKIATLPGGGARTSRVLSYEDATKEFTRGMEHPSDVRAIIGIIDIVIVNGDYAAGEAVYRLLGVYGPPEERLRSKRFDRIVSLIWATLGEGRIRIEEL